MTDKQIIASYLYKELDPAFARRAAIIATHIKEIKKGHVLEIGCGRGFYEHFLPSIYPNLKVTALDQNDSYLRVAQRTTFSQKVTFLQADALHLPFKKNSFNGAFATEVLEHLDDKQALKELFRVVKPGGIVIVTVPNVAYPFLWDPLNWVLEHLFHTHVPKDIWWLAGIWADHVRLYTPTMIKKLATQTGFTVENIYLSTHACIPFSHFLLYGIGKNIVERGFLKDFYRFNSTTKPSFLFNTIRNIMYSQDYKNKETETKETSTVNVIAVLRKP